MKTRIIDFITIILGNTVIALSIAVFVLPSGLAAGGGTGIALIVNHFTNLPISVASLIFNVIMFVLGTALLGKKFALTTAVSTFYYPIILGVFQNIIGDYCITQDIFLNTVFAGLLNGAAAGIVFRVGASTGGMDIPPLVFNKYFGIPVSASSCTFGIIILAFQFIFKNPEMILYGMVLTMIDSLVLEKVMVIGRQSVQLQIISKKSGDIKQAIMDRIERGVTVLYGETGFTEEKCSIIMSVVSNRQLLRTERLIKEIDPDAFIIVNMVKEVNGEGF
ncbi:MAG: YitT family protein [Clostridiales bacterium]|nr:YitT family protein [Clostridiales bacterium]